MEFSGKKSLKNCYQACNPSSQEAEIRRITVGSEPVQIVRKTLLQKYSIKNRAGRMD
jgi:hypothetical protein